MNLVLSAYPLSAAYKRQLEATEPSISYVHLTELRQAGIVGMLRKLRKLSPPRLIIPLEDERGTAMLPVLQTLGACSKAKSIEILDSTLGQRTISRWSIVPSAFNTAWSTCGGFVSKWRMSRELAKLLQTPRCTPQAHGSACLYIKANMWYGLKAGGSVGHVAGVVNALCRRNVDVEFASVDGPVLLDERVVPHTLPAPRSFGLPPEINLYPTHEAFVRHLKPVLASRRFGFIYQRLSLANYAGVVLSRQNNLPLVIEYNGSEVWVQKNWGRALQFQKTAAQAEDVCLKHAHLVVTISDVLRDELIERGVEPNRIVCYPNCIDPEMFDPANHSAAERVELLAAHGLPADTRLAMFLGTFGQWHGVEVLAEAIRRMSVESADWLRQHRLHFMLVGDGVKMPEVRRILDDPRCKPFHTLAGLVPQADAPRFLAAADLLLSPHVANPDGTKFFGSPTKLFEYMAMGKAIYASRLQQIGEVLQNSLDTAQLPADAPGADARQVAILGRPGNVEDLIAGIRFLTEHPDWCVSLGKHARAEALQKYTWQHHVEAILNGLH